MSRKIARGKVIVILRVIHNRNSPKRSYSCVVCKATFTDIDWLVLIIRSPPPPTTLKVISPLPPTKEEMVKNMGRSICVHYTCENHSFETQTDIPLEA